MHNKVVYHAARVFRDLGWPTLRFNFRGVGLSEGTHDGHAEADDLAAALTWLEKTKLEKARHDEFPLPDTQTHRPILAAGFSFGAAITLAVAATHRSVCACLALGLPLRSPNQQYAYPQLAHWSLPSLFLSGAQDSFASPQALAATIALAAPHAQLRLIPDADHFFTGHLDAMQQAIRDWLATLPLIQRTTSSAL